MISRRATSAGSTFEEATSQPLSYDKYPCFVLVSSSICAVGVQQRIGRCQE